MLVFNTTYLVSKASENDFLAWMKAVYVPAVQKIGLLGAPRLYKVLVSEEEGVTYSLQFDAETVADMSKFRNQYLDELEQLLFLRFGESVLHFSTYLKSCEI